MKRNQKFPSAFVKDSEINEYERWLINNIIELKEHVDRLEREKRKLLDKIEEVTGRRHEIDPKTFDVVEAKDA